MVVAEGAPAGDRAQPDETSADEDATDLDLRQRLSLLKDDGVRAKDAVAAVAEATGLAKNRVYQVWVGLGRESS